MQGNRWGSRLAVLLAEVMLVASVSAQLPDRIVIEPVPTWVVAASPSSVPEPGFAGAVDVRLMDIQSRIDEIGLHQYFHQITRIVSPEGLPLLGNFGVAWQPKISGARVHLLKIRRGTTIIDLLSGGGAFQILRREANLERQQIDGSLTAVMPIPDLRVGDELEVAWTLDQRNPVLGGRSESRQMFVPGPTFGRFLIRYSWPRKRQVAWKSGNRLPPAVAVTLSDESGFAIDQSNYSIPPVADGAPARFMEQSAIEVGEFADWGVVVKTMLPLFAEATRVTPKSAVVGEINRIAALTVDAVARASEALRSIQDNIRYFARTDGLGGYKPEAADSVWAARSGDCKGKTVLLLALLRGLGISAEAALVSSNSGDGLDARLPMPSQFDHVIVRATIAGKTYWLDGTRLGDRSIATLAVPQFKWALPIREGSRALIPLVATDPPLPEAEWRLDLDARGGIDKPANAHALLILRGERASTTRTAWSFIPGARRDEFMRKLWLERHDWIKPDTMTYRYDETLGEVRLDMIGTGDMDWNNKDGETYNEYEPARSTMGQNLTWKRPEKLQAAAPISVASRFDVSHQTVMLPDGGKGFRLEAEPIDATIGGVHYMRTQSLKNDRFEMTAITKSSEGELSYVAAVAADKATDALVKKRVFLYLPEPKVVEAAPVAQYKLRAMVEPLPRPGRGARAEYLSGSIGPDDYPPAAMRAGAQGVTAVTFDIGPDGRVHDCGISVSSGSVMLDNQSCALLTERFTYKPARGANGKFATETRTQRIKWQFPEGKAPWIEPYTLTLSYVLSADGIARDCQSSGSPKPGPFTTEQCAAAGNNVAFKDGTGKAVTVKVTEHHTRTVEPVTPATISSGSPH